MNDCSICKNYEPVTAKMAGQKTAKGNPDVVQVVRCKDCEHWGHSLTTEERQFCVDTNTDSVCDYWDSDGLMSYDFCSYGKPREVQG